MKDVPRNDVAHSPILARQGEQICKLDCQRRSFRLVCRLVRSPTARSRHQDVSGDKGPGQTHLTSLVLLTLFHHVLVSFVEKVMNGCTLRTGKDVGWEP